MSFDPFNPTDIQGLGGQPDNPLPGHFAIPSLLLSSADFGVTLTIEVRYDNFPDNTLSQGMRIYYLSPLDVADATVTLDPSIAKLSKQFVADLSAEATNILLVPYTPLGTDGSRRDYSLGGWMYAVPLLANGMPDYLSATGFVRVPVFDKNTGPADKDFYALSLNVAGPVATIYDVALTIVSPRPVFGKTQYAQVFIFNYFNDGFFRCLGVYRLHGAPGDPNGQTIHYALEADGGGHNVTFFAMYCNGLRSFPFGKVMSTFTGVIRIGGFP